MNSSVAESGGGKVVLVDVVLDDVVLDELVLDELVDEELAAVGDAGGLETAAEVLQPAVITAIDHHSQRIASA